MESLFSAILAFSGILLAVVVAVFVLAVTLLGHALEIAKQKTAQIQEEGTQKLEKQKAELQQEIGGKKQGDADLPRLRKWLEEMENTKRQLLSKTRQTTAKYGLLSVSPGVARPALASLLAAALAVGGSPLLATGVSFLGYVVAAGAIALLLLAARWLYQTLVVVQEVASGTEEAQFRRLEEGITRAITQTLDKYAESTVGSMVQAVTTALEEQEAKKRPLVKLRFVEGKPPFTFRRGATEKIKFRASLKKGDIAREVSISFFAPAGWDFPEAATFVQSEESGLPGYLTRDFEMGTLQRYLLSPLYTLPIKCPNETGTFKLYCRFYGEGIVQDLEELEIKVV